MLNWIEKTFHESKDKERRIEVDNGELLTAEQTTRVADRPCVAKTRKAAEAFVSVLWQSLY